MGGWVPGFLTAGAVDVYLVGLEAIDEDQLVASGQFGPRVPVADDAPSEVRLLACTGRDPRTTEDTRLHG